MSQLLWNAFIGGNLWSHFLEALMQILYALAGLCYSILDLLQLMFRYMCGLEVYELGEAGLVSGDIFYQIFSKTFLTGGLNGGMWGTDGQYSIFAIAFWSLVILAAILLFVSTIAAIIKNEYSPDKEKKNSKAGIIKNFFKAVASFFLVPIACYFGLRLGNAVLFALDSAVTSSMSYTLTNDDVGDFSTYFKSESVRSINEDGTDTRVKSYSNFIMFGKRAPMKYPSISGLVNRTCLYGSSRIRNSNFYETDIAGGKNGSLGFLDSLDRDKAADVVDIGFMLNARLQHDYNFTMGTNGDFYESSNYDTWGGANNGKAASGSYMNRADIHLISYYYDLSNYNIILAIAFIYIGGKALLQVTFGLVGRIMVLMAMLFIEPIPLAYMPIDNGGAFGRWSKKFFGQVVAVFSINLTMNLFYIVCPIFTSIKFFVNMDLAFANTIVQSIFIIAFMSMISKIDSMILMVLAGEKQESVSDWGAGIQSSVTDAAKSTARVATSAAKLGVGAVKVGAHAIGAVASGAMAVGSGIAGAVSKGRRNKLRNEGAKNNTQIARGAAAKSADTKMSKGADGKNTLGTDIAFGNYQANGGKMDQETWMKNTGADSYMAAKASGAKNDKELREYFNQHGGGTDQDFKNWKKEGKNTEKEFNSGSLKSLSENGGISTYDQAQIYDTKNGRSISDEDARKERDTARNQLISEEQQKVNEMAAGTRTAANPEEQKMLDDYNAGVTKRDMARHDAAIQEEIYQKRSGRAGRSLKRFGGHLSTGLRSATGDILGAIGGLAPPPSK